MWNDLFCYDESSPTFLIWKHRNEKSKLKIIAGSVPLDVGTYSSVHVGDKSYLVHRIIYELKVGYIPDGYVVDHLNGDTTFNSIENLRCCTQKVNCQNKKKSVTNRSGVAGVHLRVDSRGYEKWVAQWQRSDGRRGSKVFSITKFGYDKAFDLAVKHRELMITTLVGEGQSYTERHGKDEA